MSIKITNQPFSWPCSSVDPSWTPLRCAPFLYRVCSAEDWCEGWENGTPDQQLEAWLRQAGVHEATIDRASGEFRLALPEGKGGPFSLPICCHPAEFDPAEIRDVHLRGIISAQVLFVWTRMQDEFRRAVAERRCIVVARAWSMLSELTVIASDVFQYFEITDWQKGEAVNAAGEKLFSIHVVSQNVISPDQPEQRPQPQPQPGSVPEKICTFLQLKYPNGKPDNVTYASVADAFREDEKLLVSEAWVRQTAQKFLGWPKRAKKA